MFFDKKKTYLVVLFLEVLEFQKSQLPRFHVPFWLSYILVYLFYFRPS